MHTMEDFESAISKSPEDITQKLVFADWLDERGDVPSSIRAKLTRDLCRVQTGELVDPYAVPVEILHAVASGFAKPDRERINAPSEFEMSLMPWFRESWLAVGLAAAPCDRAAVEAAVELAYAKAGLQPPKWKVWLSGPFHGAVAAAMLVSLRDHVGDQVTDQVGAQVADQVTDQLRDQVRAQVRDQVWAQVWDQVEDQVKDQVGDPVRDQVTDQLMAQVDAQVWGAQVYRCGYGQHDVSWLAFYAYFSSVGLAACDRLAGLFAMSACGWWWPFEGAVILTERPTLLEMRERELMTIEYADGLRIDHRK